MAQFFNGLGKRVKSIREKQKYSQATVADKADISLRHYQDLEAGFVVSLRMIWSVANALETSVSKLTKDLGPGK